MQSLLIPLTMMIGPAAPTAMAESPPPVVLQAEVQAPSTEVWRALTTREGVISFFGPEAHLEPRLDGPYEIYFLLNNPPGLRGSEGVRILAMEEPYRLLISWNAPPSFGPLRSQRTVVEFQLTPLGSHATLLTTTHSGWGRGEAWQRVRDYFAQAWPVVLGRLQYRFLRGPVDWRHPPEGAALFHPAGMGGHGGAAGPPKSRPAG